MAMSADLGKTLEKFVTKLVASGRYHSKSEVLREGVRLIQEREARLAALDASIARGLAAADADRVSNQHLKRLIIWNRSSRPKPRQLDGDRCRYGRG